MQACETVLILFELTVARDNMNLCHIKVTDGFLQLLTRQGSLLEILLTFDMLAAQLWCSDLCVVLTVRVHVWHL